MKRIFTISLLCFLANSCFSQSLSDDTLHWGEYKQLSWADFKGTSIDLPNPSGQAYFSVLANYQKLSVFLPAKTNVETVLDRKNSWVSLNYPKTKASLQYFQDMFDLYEVYARKLKRSFSKTKLGLDADQIFHKLYNDNITQLSDRSKQMMGETKMGTDSAAVYKWGAQIQAELQELKDLKTSGNKKGRLF